MSSWNLALHGSHSQKAEALVDMVTDGETGLIVDLEMTANTLAAAQVHALLALEDTLREQMED